MDRVEIHLADSAKVISCAEPASCKGLIECLRYRNENEGPLRDHHPPKLYLWIKLLGGWPSLTSGGSKYLIQVWNWFVIQADTLQMFELRWGSKISLKQLT